MPAVVIPAFISAGPGCILLLQGLLSVLLTIACLVISQARAARLPAGTRWFIRHLVRPPGRIDAQNSAEDEVNKDKKIDQGFLEFHSW
jgi:hypothetical protein